MMLQEYAAELVVLARMSPDARGASLVAVAQRFALASLDVENHLAELNAFDAGWVDVPPRGIASLLQSVFDHRTPSVVPIDPPW